MLFLVGVISGMLVFGLWLKWYRETTKLLTGLSPTRGPEEESLSAHRRRIVWTLLGTAALCDRAAIESLAREGKIAEAQRGVGRQRALSVGRLEPVWARLGEVERNLLIADEGSWTWDETWPWIVRGEDVRVMRWVIGMDEVLRPFEFLKPDLLLVFRTTTHAEETNGDRCLAAYDLRPAQTMAQAMVSRCAAEGVLRGEYEEDDAAVRAELVALAERMGADESSDFLIGTKTVAKASEKDLRWVGQAAVRRMVVLGGLIDYLNGPAEAELRIAGRE